MNWLTIIASLTFLHLALCTIRMSYLGNILISLHLDLTVLIIKLSLELHNRKYLFSKVKINFVQCFISFRSNLIACDETYELETYRSVNVVNILIQYMAKFYLTLIQCIYDLSAVRFIKALKNCIHKISSRTKCVSINCIPFTWYMDLFCFTIII